MGRGRSQLSFLLLSLVAVAAPWLLLSQSSPAAQHHKITTRSEFDLDAGLINKGVYHNKTLALSCKIPPGWVLRTEEMNEREYADPGSAKDKSQPPSAVQGKQGTQKSIETDRKAEGGRVLLAAFSRPPDAHGEEVNSSILIAVESVASYPGLTDAAQYFGPLTEVAKAQGFVVDEEPYGVAIGAKTLVRGDFHKDVGTRVMLQSTLAWLVHGYAVSITVIGGTDDEVEELMDGLSFGAAPAGKK
jgi:hypothetical protein